MYANFLKYVYYEIKIIGNERATLKRDCFIYVFPHN